MAHRITATLLTAALAGAAALTVGADAVSAAPVRVTQSFQAQATAQLATGATGFILADQDVQAAGGHGAEGHGAGGHSGTVIGHDVLSCTVAAAGPSCDVAFAQAGGILDAHFTISDATGKLSGIVHGGTGRFRSVYGTLSGTTLSRSAVQITLHYHR